MVLSTFYYFLVSLFLRSDAVLLVKPYPTAVPALWVQRRKGARVVIDVDDLDYAYSRGWFRSLHQRLQKPWPAWADIVTYHNPELLKPLRDFFRVPPSRLVQLPQGVDRDIFNSGSVQASHFPATAAWLQGTPPKGPLLAFTAHLNVACDLEPVLESFKRILESFPQAGLLVAGGGPDEARFRRLAGTLGLKDSVYFTGMVSPLQVAACLKASDAALVYYRDTPVNRHRASMKLREALACGLKVVATRVGEAALWKNALILSAPTPAAFAKAVLRALRVKKSPQAGSLLVKNWDWVRCVEKLEKELSSKCDV